MVSVLHVNTERGWRGGERQVLLLADALHRAGHRSIVAARPGEPLAKRLEERGVPVIPCAPAFELDPVAALRLRRFIRREGIQIVHTHTAHAHALAALAAHGTSARIIVSRRVDFLPRRNPVTTWKYTRADAIIAVSSAVAKALFSAGIPPERVHVVPDGIDLANSGNGASRAAAAALGVVEDAPLVVMAAALVPHKDPVTFIRAIGEARKHVPRLHALLMGEGVLRRDVEAEIDRLGLRETVRLTGYVPDAGEVFDAADVVALSSQQEGLGTVILDAMSRGVPVVVTRAGGIPEIVEDGRNGFVVPIGDAEMFGKQLARLLTDPDLARQMGLNARKRAADFSIDKTVAGTLAVYRAVLGSKRTVPARANGRRRAVDEASLA